MKWKVKLLKEQKDLRSGVGAIKVGEYKIELEAEIFHSRNILPVYTMDKKTYLLAYLYVQVTTFMYR